jgi:RHS repeat-associated protein
MLRVPVTLDKVRVSRQRTLPNGTGFRKAHRARSRSHPSQSQRFRLNSHTCFEGPFGEVIRATGPMAKANPFRFSTKYQDDETDLLYYGYRYYNVATGRWNSRDPIAETGGANLYQFVHNNALDSVDARGLCGCCECAVSISIDIIVPYEKHPIYGFPSSYFEVTIALTYLKSDKPGRAEYQWWENTNLPPGDYTKGGAKPNEWFNVRRIYPPPGNWTTRDTSCDPEVSRLVLDGDMPYQSLDRPKRVLHIKPTVINPPCCGKDYRRVVEATVVQTIDPTANPPVTIQTPDPNPPPMPPSVQ